MTGKGVPSLLDAHGNRFVLFSYPGVLLFQIYFNAVVYNTLLCLKCPRCTPCPLVTLTHLVFFYPDNIARCIYNASPTASMLWTEIQKTPTMRLDFAFALAAFRLHALSICLVEKTIY